MKIPVLALRNLLRNRRRSLTTLLAMMVGLVAVLVFGGYSSNVIYATQTGIVQFTGHLQIQHQDYFLYGSGNPTEYGITDYQRIIDVVGRDPVMAPLLNVQTPILVFGGLAGNFEAGVSRTVLGVGLVVEDQNKMRRWNDYGGPNFVDPLPLTHTSTDAAVIGTGVARELQLCGPLKVAECHSPKKKAAKPETVQLPADIAALSSLEQSGATHEATRIELLATSNKGMPNVASLNVVHAENKGSKELNDLYLAMHLPKAQRLLFGATAPQVTAIQIQLQHTDQVPAARQRLQYLLSTHFKDRPLVVHDFETLMPIYGQTVSFMQSVVTFIAVLIGAIVVFTISNTMSAAVVERTVEIGTLRAMGLRRDGIRRLFICEAALLGIVGTALGTALALLVAYLINQSGLDYIPPGYARSYPIIVRIWSDLPLLLGSSIGLMAVALFSAWWPANRAARMVIVDALRHA
ncbi:ABC transporter permease [Chitinimonas lacunae]|uniref:ABC transporter permease n=1 Tax=Chitinimonas lacunae TaxID=1963018 RepID=A0ABV8MM15_9NEIS